MREDFLHYIWKHKKFQFTDLQTANNEPIHIHSVGNHNHNAGPDFFSAKLEIANQLWAGNVEIHIKSSDWYVHGHEADKNYDNVILHVVWDHDTEIYRKDNSEIPTLELKRYTSIALLDSYQKLFSKKKKWINCEVDLQNVDEFLVRNWLERLYFERLEIKSKAIQEYLSTSKNDWEATLFIMLAKNFGLKVNGESFFAMAKSIDFAVVKKCLSKLHYIEALFFGQAGLLDSEIEDNYHQQLKSDYHFLKRKFKLNNLGVLQVSFFRLRPPNFPTIRLSQLAHLYNTIPNLFSELMNLKTKEEFYELLNIKASDYWDSHYNFKNANKFGPKKLTKSFIDLLLINTIIPLKFCYAASKGKDSEDEILGLIQSIDMERNIVVSKFQEARSFEKSALTSQALLQLKHNYCDQHNCLNCAVGNSLLKS